VTSVFKEIVSIESNNLGLVRLSNIGKDDIDHADEHAVLVWVPGVLNDGDNVGALLGLDASMPSLKR
jgi:hypothetical protein